MSFSEPSLWYAGCQEYQASIYLILVWSFSRKNSVLRSNYSTNYKLKLDFYESKRFLGVFLTAFSYPAFVGQCEAQAAEWGDLTEGTSSIRADGLSGRCCDKHHERSDKGEVIKEWWFTLWSSCCLTNPQIKIPTPQADTCVLNSDFSNTFLKLSYITANKLGVWWI